MREAWAPSPFLSGLFRLIERLLSRLLQTKENDSNKTKIFLIMMDSQTERQGKKRESSVGEDGHSDDGGMKVLILKESRRYVGGGVSSELEGTKAALVFYMFELELLEFFTF